MRRSRLDRQARPAITSLDLVARTSKHRASKPGHQHQPGSPGRGNTYRAVTRARRSSRGAWVTSYQRAEWARSGRLVTASTALRRITRRVS